MGFTLDAVAARTSVSKGALLHHFPTKLALLEGMTDHLADMFCDAIMAEAAKDPQPYGRQARAYLRVTINDATTAYDVSIGRAMLVACAIEPELRTRWADATRRVKTEDPTDPVGADDALLLRLLADGLWMSDLFGVHDVLPVQRQALLSLLTPGHTLIEAA